MALLAALWLMSWVRPGWTRRAGRKLRPLAGGAGQGLGLLGAVAVGLAVDPLARAGLVRGLIGSVLPLLAPVGTWLSGPSLPRDLGLLALGVAILAADRRAPLSVRLPPLSRLVVERGAQSRTALAVGLPVALLLLAWVDVLGSTLGVHAASVFRQLAAGGWLGWHPAARLAAEPDPRLVPLYWWLAAVLVALGARRWLPGRGRAWVVVPLLGALLGWLGRDLGLSLALPAFVVAAAVGTALAREKGVVAERAAVLGLLGLALALRWTPAVLRPPASDTGGYFEVARTFWDRVAEAGTNPIALAYLNMHPASREPLFPLVLVGAFGPLGASVVHQRYVTITLAVVGVYLTYRFGRAYFGAVPGLLAGLVVAVLPWQVMVSQEGLREELALACVYGLALLVVTWPVPLRGEGLPGRPVGWPLAVVGGTLAAGAVLTRLDAGVVVVALLVAWGVRLGRAWRATLPAWIVSGALVAPLLVGYVLRAGDPLTPLRGSMGGDIQTALDPLARGELPASYALRATALGTREVYAGTIFGSAAERLPGAVRPAAVAVALAATAVGLVTLLARGPRLPALLVVLGVYAPPFAFLAGTSLLHGPGGGYTERYTYLILPATLAVCAWVLVGAVGAAGRAARKVVAARVGLDTRRLALGPARVSGDP